MADIFINEYVLLDFLTLYLLNLILDYPLQGSFLAEYKSKMNYLLFVHSAIWGLGIFIVSFYMCPGGWWKLPMLVFGHMLIDWWKCRGIYKKWTIRSKVRKIHDNGAVVVTVVDKQVISDKGALYIDQFLHVVQVALCML